MMSFEDEQRLAQAIYEDRLRGTEPANAWSIGRSLGFAPEDLDAVLLEPDGWQLAGWWEYGLPIGWIAAGASPAFGWLTPEGIAHFQIKR